MENIEGCLDALKDVFGFSSSSGFDDWRKNSSSEYKKKNSYRDYYSDYSREYIEDHFIRDLDYFGYGF